MTRLELILIIGVVVLTLLLGNQITSLNSRITAEEQKSESILNLTKANTHDIIAVACVLRPDFSPICKELAKETNK